MNITKLIDQRYRPLVQGEQPYADCDALTKADRIAHDFAREFCPASEAPARAEMRARIAEMIANDRCEIVACHHGLTTECAACIAETEGM
jgi:hypothetical protein